MITRMVLKYWAVCRAGVLVCWLRLLLRVKSLPGILAVITPGSMRMNQRETGFEDMIYYVDRWLAMFPYNKRGNCFPRSLALYRLASQAGYPVHFHCGVRRMGAGLDGHAWVTLNGRPFHEPTLHWTSFTVTFTYPSVCAASRVGDRSAQHRGARNMRLVK